MDVKLTRPEAGRAETANSSVEVQAFIAILWEMLKESKYEHLISWDPDGLSFCILNQSRFANEVLPHYFRHNNISSFVRQLNMYGFHKISTTTDQSLFYTDANQMHFQHEYFVRGRVDLLPYIRRRRTTVAELHGDHLTTSQLAEHIQEMRQRQDKMQQRLDRLERDTSQTRQQNSFLTSVLATMRRKQDQQQDDFNRVVQYFVQLVNSGRFTNAQLKRMDSVFALTDGSSKESVEDFHTASPPKKTRLIDELTKSSTGKLPADSSTSPSEDQVDLDGLLAAATGDSGADSGFSKLLSASSGAGALVQYSGTGGPLGAPNSPGIVIQDVTGTASPGTSTTSPTKTIQPTSSMASIVQKASSPTLVDQTPCESPPAPAAGRAAASPKTPTMIQITASDGRPVYLLSEGATTVQPGTAVLRLSESKDGPLTAGKPSASPKTVRPGEPILVGQTVSAARKAPARTMIVKKLKNPASTVQPKPAGRTKVVRMMTNPPVEPAQPVLHVQMTGPTQPVGYHATQPVDVTVPVVDPVQAPVHNFTTLLNELPTVEAVAAAPSSHPPRLFIPREPTLTGDLAVTTQAPSHLKMPHSPLSDPNLTQLLQTPSLSEVAPAFQQTQEDLNNVSLDIDFMQSLLESPSPTSKTDAQPPTTVAGPTDKHSDETLWASNKAAGHPSLDTPLITGTPNSQALWSPLSQLDTIPYEQLLNAAPHPASLPPPSP